MGDVWCDWCGAALPESGRHRRRYCGPAHRQAAWRARRRLQAAAVARHEMVLASRELLVRLEAVTQEMNGFPAAVPEAGCHCAAVAEVPKLAGQLVRSAVLADRQAGASWAQIGARFGISGEAARARYGRTRGRRRPPADTEWCAAGSTLLPVRALVAGN